MEQKKKKQQKNPAVLEAEAETGCKTTLSLGFLANSFKIILINRTNINQQH